MVLATFHNFTHLPVEIRLMIWKAAVRPSGASIHYFSVVPSDKVCMKIKPCHNDCGIRDSHSYWCQGYKNGTEIPKKLNFIAPISRNPQGYRSAGQGELSVYNSDLGLWLACRESRQIIKKYFRGAPFTVSPWFHPRCAARHARGYYQHMIATRHTTGEVWHSAIDPINDLICIKQIDPTTDYDNWSWKSFYLHLPFYDTLCPVRKFAFDFDPTWNIGIEDDVFCTKREVTPRGIFIKFVQNSKFTAAKGAEILLIDRGLRHYRKIPESPAYQGFFDCGHKYGRVQIDIQLDQGFDDAQDPDHTTVIYFLYELKTIFRSQGIEFEWYPSVLACERP
ncbi:hypothetical protein NM208_g5636 [Fusarium decemcellulare]|uniref:Uncharacterized protein n=1 Tax=Fusarium decemcellulare TaxID=57161 RepID=A0ACC1SGB4_9HYPO|nr:hypothetical protein NM208_g5636 [Fusarium decemcellulare]